MIEINLLPADQRQPEGTPLPRLMSIIGGAVLAVVGILWVSKYYMVEIPQTEQQIAQKSADKTRWQAKVAETDRLREEINRIKQKVAALRNLERSRVRWARLLYRFRNAIPDGCVIRTFAVSPEPAGPATFGQATSGPRYRITLSGLTSGESQQECSTRLTQIVENFKREFEINTAIAQTQIPGTPGSTEVDLMLPYKNFLGLRFNEPSITNFQHTPNFPKVNVPEEARDSFVDPSRGLNFNMHITLSLPPPEQTTF